MLWLVGRVEAAGVMYFLFPRRRALPRALGWEGGGGGVGCGCRGVESGPPRGADAAGMRGVGGGGCRSATAAAWWCLLPDVDGGRGDGRGAALDGAVAQRLMVPPRHLARPPRRKGAWRRGWWRRGSRPVCCPPPPPPDPITSGRELAPLIRRDSSWKHCTSVTWTVRTLK